MSSGQTAAESPRNPPAALRMASIAFLHHNIAIAGIWGTFSVFLVPVEARLGIGRELSTLAIPAVNLSSAVFALAFGALATRVSLRLLMVVSAALSTLGFALLAAVPSYPVYLLAYGLFLGPGMAACAVLPGTLVTRWYVQGRGRAFGVAYAPVVVTFTPLVATWILRAHGLPATYWALAALSAVAVLASLFVVDHPPGAAQADAVQPTAATPAGPGLAGFFASPLFWALAVAYFAATSGAIILTAHMAPIALAWGFSPERAAVLLAVQAFCGIPGAVALGWIADRLGGALTSAIVAFNCALLWSLLLLAPPFPGTVVLVGLIGVHAAGAVPVLSVALSKRFGQEGYSRAFGLINLMNLPFSMIAVPAAAMVYAQTRSYAGAIAGQAGFFVLTALVLLVAERSSAARLRTAAAET